MNKPSDVLNMPDPGVERLNKVLDEEKKKQNYLATCNKLELKSLEVSKASKALNLLKTEEEALRVEREKQRKELMGDIPNNEQGKSAPVYPYGHRGSGRFA
jgi:hypothetical protein